MSKQLSIGVNPDEFGIEKKTATELTQGLSTILAERAALQAQYKEIIDLEITEDNTKVFRELRLKIRDNRTKGIEVWHKNSKNYFLRGGQFVDAIKNKEAEVNKGMEEKLADAEKHFENIEKERKAKLRQERVEKLEKFEVDCTHVQVEEMDEPTFENYLEAQKGVWERKQEKEREEREAEEARERAAELLQTRKDEVRHLGNHFPWPELDIDTTEKDFKAMVKKAESALMAHEKEQEKLREEAAKREKELAKERAEREKERKEAETKAEKERKEHEAKMAKEREAAAAKLKKEQEEREKLQKQVAAREKAEQEQKEKEAAEAEARKSAPDKDKLIDLRDRLAAFELPEMESQKGKKTVENVKILLGKVQTYIDERL